MHLPYRFGKYVLDQKIAQGGMAEIYRARYLGESGFEKRVAIKRILPVWSGNKDFVAMLCDEAKALVRLQHQNIVQVYELGKDGEVFYISMEYVDGIDLRRLFNKLAGGETLHLKLICFIISEMLKGLDISHNRGSGIIHRDISPQNILLSFSGEVKIADFGIAKGFHRSFETVVSQVKGKYAYMSPEQAEGRPVDARTDIYAVGVILYELLTRERLHNAQNDLLTLEEVKRSVLPHGWDDGMPCKLRTMVAKALMRDMTKRYQTAAEFLKDLNDLVLEERLITGNMELSNCIKMSFRDEFESSLRDEDVVIDDVKERRHETKVLSIVSRTRPEKRAGSGVRRYSAVASFALFAALFGSGSHSFQGAAVAEVRQEKEIVKPAADIVRDPSSTISINAKPWGYVYIPGLVVKKETPVKGVKLKPGEYDIKVFYEPSNKWLTSTVSVKDGSRTTCLADFTGEPKLRCREKTGQKRITGR